MKKILILILVLNLASCNDFLEEVPQGEIVGNTPLKSVEGLEAALTGTYKGILRTWERGFVNASTMYFTMGGDDLTTIKGGNTPKFWGRQIDQFEVTSGNEHLNHIWKGCYKTIQGASNIINNYESVQGDQVQIKSIVGEAYFLRALSYYWLVRGWGRVPLILTAEFSEELLNVNLSEPAEIYAVIESDLKIAEDFVGDKKRNPGRPNKGSVKALLADVYLTMGGWPIKDEAKYALAATKAKEVIDNSETYGFALADLADLWSGNEAAIGTSEEVMTFHTSTNFGGSANAFWNDAARPGDVGGWDDYMAEINFFLNFPEGKRKDLTFLTDFVKNDETVIPWETSESGHPYYEKFHLDQPNWQSGMPVHIIRYAHVLLIYAEAQARSAGSPSPDAYAAINAIRERAGLEGLAGLSGTDFINAVVNERAWEFAGEYQRWFDLQRLELVEEANANKHVNGLSPMGAITKDDYWFPIPQDDALINPNLN